MVRVEMLAVGKELLIGRTLNTNAQWVGKRLAMMGSMLKEVTTVDDELAEIGAAFRASIERSPDFLVVVGGLGPTPDDMTLKGVAKAMGVRLAKSEEALRMIKEHYAKIGRSNIELTPSRLKMAILPSSASAVRNEAGTAPGVRLVAGKSVVYCLPGVPLEMRRMFRESVEPEVRGRLGRVFRTYIMMKVEGVPESTLAPLIAQELGKHPTAYVKSHPRGVREGVARIELDIAVAGRNRHLIVSKGGEIAEDMARAIVELGGRIVTRRSLEAGRD